MNEPGDKALDLSTSEALLNWQWVNHLLDADPHNPQLWFKKAINFQNAMKGIISKTAFLERVLSWYQQCLREEPTNWVHYFNSANLLYELNRYEDALELCQKAAEMKPDNPHVQRLLVTTLLRLGLERQAIEAFKKAAKHGVELNPDILGGRVIKENVLFDSPSLKEHYRNSISAKEQVQQGAIPYIVEAADPEIQVFQFELDQLIRLGFSEVAEDLCINFELAHGMNNITRSSLFFLKGQMELDFAAWAMTGAEVIKEISAAYPLLEISKLSNIFSSAYQRIVDSLFEEDKVSRFITPQEVDDFDEQARWYMQQLASLDYTVNNLSYVIQPILPDILQVWNMVTLNFIVARKLNDPALITYTATTLANFYKQVEAPPTLVFFLYTRAAAAAEVASQWDYFANAQCKCAMILKNKSQFGSAINHIEKTIKYIEKIHPFNQFDTYYTLAECYSHLDNFEQAKQYYSKAYTVQNVPDTYTENAHLALARMDAKIAGKIAFLRKPSILCKDLKIQIYHMETAQGLYAIYYTSKHELYDSLLDLFDDIYRVRQSVQERDTGYTYFQGYAKLMEALVRTALELELPGNALVHLETQKSIILSNRLKYLLRDKPADLPDSYWEDLHRWITIHRNLFEKPDDLESDLVNLSGLTLQEAENAIGRKLWECSQISEVRAKQIQQKLAFSKFPKKIECADPESTLILEFCSQACFLIHPDNPMNPEVIELPEATLQESERLVQELFEIVQEWLAYFSQSSSLATIPPSQPFSTFLTRFDEVFYQPIARRLDSAKIKNICIIPHRVLHVLPLNLLGLSDQSGESLGERFAVSFAPSLTCVKSLSNLPRKKPEGSLIVTNPVPRCPNKSCRNPDHNCFSIEKAEQESHRLHSHLKTLGVDVVSLQGENATLKTVSSELGLADIVHFATHGIFDPQHPENSGLLLSIPEDRADSQALYLLHNKTRSKKFEPSTVGEILSLDYIWKNIDMFRCQLLNLSACSAAMVDWTEQSDEFYGITNGFLYAGVQNIVSSLWQVHDLASQVFNLQFYEALLSNDYDPIYALKAAIGSLKEFELEGKKPFAHPLFWAGYRVIGFS